jgi:chitin synthase
MPGSFEDEEDDAQDEMSTNIRYGRIPQRVPRRYKTIKKFE